MRDFDRDSWSRLMSGENPFLQHEFLATLEGSGCVHERTGWLPLHHGIKDSEQSCITRGDPMTSMRLTWIQRDHQVFQGTPNVPLT